MTPEPGPSPNSPPVATHPTTRAGYVTLVGKPNAGKSTLLNALVGTSLSIVTAKPQTTWERVTAIQTGRDAQMIFLDTPGLLAPRDLLQRSMLAQALEAVHEADVILAVVDPSSLSERDREALQETLDATDVPRIVAVNKSDIAPEPAVAAAVSWAESGLGARAFVVSAAAGTGLEPLRQAVAEALPEGPFLYDPEDIATKPVRFFVAELVRETVFEQFHQEIPYSVMCLVEELREAQDPVYVGVTVFVERSSQKGILVGERGAAIRELGKASRAKIEHFLGRPVYLDLWVKVLPDWRRRRAHLVRLGFHVPEGDDAERR